ncbi:hypothetical protein PanWU01x14_304560, partial [Parasponia andersonii]
LENLLFALKNGGGHGGGGIPDELVEGFEGFPGEEAKSLNCTVLFDPGESSFSGDDRFGNVEEHEALDSTLVEKEEEREGRKFTRGGVRGGGGGGGGALKLFWQTEVVATGSLSGSALFGEFNSTAGEEI